MRKRHLGEQWNDVSAAILARLRARFGDVPQATELPALLTVGRR